MARSRKTASAAGYLPVMVSLHCVNQVRASEGAPASGRGRQYAAMRALAREQRNEVVGWLEQQGLAEQFKRVSEVTAFGTFTLEVTPGVMRTLPSAPHVESVTRVGDLPLKLISALP